jgi:hypothetical protein
MSIACTRLLVAAALVVLSAAVLPPSAAPAETSAEGSLWSVAYDVGRAWDAMFDVRAVEYNPAGAAWPDMPFGLSPSVAGGSFAIMSALGDRRNGPASVTILTIDSQVQPPPELPWVCGTMLLERPGIMLPRPESAAPAKPAGKVDLIVAKASGDGSSAENAVIIEAKTEEAGVAKEYEYIEKTCGKRGEDWQLITQDLYSIKGRDYDMLAIRLQDGTRREVWFDITSFFGVEIPKALEDLHISPRPAKPDR